MIVCIIPAKGNSTRIPGKNMRNFLDRPIIEYSLETAARCGIFDQIWVSTNDQAIADLATNVGFGVVRRKGYLCEEEGVPDCGTQEVTRDAIESIEPHGMPVEYACCLYATAPLLIPRDLLQAQRALMRIPSPAFSYAVGADGKDAGAFYFGHAKAFLDRVPLFENAAKVYLPAERTCDINTFEDWERAERMYVALHNKEE